MSNKLFRYRQGFALSRGTSQVRVERGEERGEREAGERGERREERGERRERREQGEEGRGRKVRANTLTYRDPPIFFYKKVTKCL